MKFAPEYVTHVLNENFEDAKELLLSPLMAINYAHLVMLAEQGIISKEDARSLRDALVAACRAGTVIVSGEKSEGFSCDAQLSSRARTHGCTILAFAQNPPTVWRQASAWPAIEACLAAL